MKQVLIYKAINKYWINERHKMLTGIIIKYKSWECEIEISNSMTGQTIIELIDIITDEPILIATTSIPEDYLDENEVLIENAEIRKLMAKKGLIASTSRLLDAYPNLPVCTIVEPRMMHPAAV